MAEKYSRARQRRRLGLLPLRNLSAAAVLAPILLALVLALSLSLEAAYQASPQRTKKKAPLPLAPIQELPAPFNAGEALTYRVSWSAFSNAASLQLNVPERRDLYGWQTWHFRGVAHTLNPVRTLFPIDDQFDSYSDAATLDSRQFETHLNEIGKQADQIQRLAASGRPSRLPPPIVVVPAGTRDALGVVYALRAVDWQRTPEFRSPVYDGKDIFEVQAAREATEEPVKVAAGTFAASRIAIRVYQYHRELSNVHYVMWIASDASRTPVAMQANLPFGNIRAELTSATH